MISEHIVYEYFIFNKMKDLTKYDFFILLLIIFWDLKKKKLNSILIDNI